VQRASICLLSATVIVLAPAGCQRRIPSHAQPFAGTSPQHASFRRMK